MMRPWGLIAAAWLLVPTAFAQQVVREQPVILQLDVDTQGRIAAVKVMDPPILLVPRAGDLVRQPPLYAPLPPVLAQAAGQVASSWRFRPILVAGKPVTGRTWATAVLQVVKRDDGNFGVDLRYLRNGPYMTRAVVPEYRRIGVLGTSGGLAVEYMVQPDGTVSGLQVLQAAGDAMNHQDLFEHAVRDALRQCRELPLLVDGKAVLTRVRAAYILVNANAPKDEADRLSRQLRGAANLTVSTDSEAPPLRPGEAVAIDSPFLKQPPG